MKAKELFLVRGLPGAGKTTIAKGLSVFNISADECWSYDYTVDPRGFDTDELRKAHERCKQTVEIWMRNNKTKIAVHNTFTTHREMRPYYNLAKHYGYRVHRLVVEHVHEGESEHNVPKETIDKMRERFVLELG